MNLPVGVNSPEAARAQDLENLRVLSLTWRVLAAVVALLLFLILTPFVITMLFRAGGLIQYLQVGLVVSVVAVPSALLAASAYIVSLDLERRQNRDRCIVIAVLACLLPPIGLVLGVVTIAVLSRLSVRSLFFPEDVTAGRSADR